MGSNKETLKKNCRFMSAICKTYQENEESFKHKKEEMLGKTVTG